MTAYVALQVTSSSTTSPYLIKFANIIRIQLLTNAVDHGVCIDASLDAVSKAELSGWIPFGVGAAMVVILLTQWAISRLYAWRQSTVVTLEERLLPQHQQRLPSGSASVNSLPPVEIAGTTNSNVSNSNNIRTQYLSVALNFILTVYSAFVVVVVSLLHCVHVPGTPESERRLFIQGTMVCTYTGNQAAYVIAALLLVAIPTVFMPLLTLWAVRHHRQSSDGSSVEGPSVTSRSSWKDDVSTSLITALVAPYRPQLPWWESILMLQRLFLAFLFTFGSSIPSIKTFLSITLCVVAFAGHVYFQPFKRPDTQRLQSILLFCLCITALACSDSASLLDAASTADNPGTDDFYQSVTDIFQYVVPVIVFALSFVGQALG